MKLTAGKKYYRLVKSNSAIVLPIPAWIIFLSFFLLLQFFKFKRKCFYLGLLLLLQTNEGWSQVVINEIGIAPAGGNNNGGEFIELFNKSACAVDLSCYTIVFSSTSGALNPTGWTLKIPSGYSIPSCGYFVIGGISGQAGISGTGYPTGGTVTPYTGTANLDIGTTAITANAVYMLQSLNAGTFPDAGGQLTLLYKNQ